MTETLQHHSPEEVKQQENPAKYTRLVEKQSLPLVRAEFKNQVEAKVASSENIIVTSHKRPDDDAMCAALAQKRILEKKFPGKNIKVVFSDKPIDAWDKLLKSPDQLSWPSAQKKKVNDETTRNGDVADYINSKDTLICLDGGTFEKFSNFQDKIASRDDINTVILDHHRDPASPSTISLVEPEAFSTCELLAKMHDIEDLDPDVCTLLLIGMLSDTGDFSFNQDYTESIRVAAQLLKKSGKDLREIRSLVKISEQCKAFEQFFANHIHKVDKPSMPKTSYAYVTGKELVPQIDSKQKGYDMFIARRNFMFKQTKSGEAELYWTVLPDANLTNYSVSFRRDPDSQLDLHLLGKYFGQGGHGGAAAGNYILTGEKLAYLKKQKEQNPDWNEMDYVGELIVEKVEEYFKKANNKKS